MTQLHPDDEALLERLTFSRPHSRPNCDRCKKVAVTAIVMMVQGNSGPGWDVRYCRPCVAIRFVTCRRLGGRGYVPARLPAYG